MKKRWIKICSVILMVCLIILNMPTKVEAASVSVWADTTQAQPGQTITFTVSGQGAGYVNISGAVNQSIWIENSAQSFTVTAPASGAVSITVSGILADFDSEQDVPVSGGATVYVQAPAPAPQPEAPQEQQPNQDQQKQEEEQKKKEEEERKKKEQEEDKKNNLRLASLTVSQGQLSPDFNPDVYSYEVTVDSSVKEIEIDAKAQEEIVEIQGLGKKLIKEGENRFEIVTSSSKTERTNTYELIVHKRAKGMLIKNSKAQEFEILTEEIPSLEGFKEHFVKIKNKDYPALYSEKKNLILLYCLNEKQEANFYIYNEKKNRIESIYIPVTFFGRNYALIDCEDPWLKNLKETKLTLDEKEVQAYSFKNKNFKGYSLLYLMNEEGDIGFYQYEENEKTLQKYSKAAFITMDEYEDLLDQKIVLKKLLVGSLIINSILVLLMIGLILWMKRI